MKVLVACEESQRVCTEFRHLGHEAYSCDILECSGGYPEWHIQGDVLPYIDGSCIVTTMDGTAHRIDGTWDLLIAHPPCTYMSNAGACRMYPRKGVIDPVRFQKAMIAKSFFLKFYYADCPRICVENPVPMKCIGLPPKSQAIQPYMFGDPWSKKTYLWLRGLPQLQPTKICASYKPFVPSGTSRKLGGDSYGAKQCAKSSRERAKTFPGIAQAMAQQWGGSTKKPAPAATDNGGMGK